MPTENQNPTTIEEPQVPAAVEPDAPAPSDPAPNDPPTSPPVAETDPFTKGLEELKAQEEAAVPPPPDPAAAPDGDPPPPAVGQSPAVPDAAAAGEGGNPPTAADPAVEEEIAAYGLKPKAAERFRELTKRAADADVLRARAGTADEWEQTIQSTGANPQQFGAALGYLRAVNSGSPEEMAKAYEAMEKELQWLGQRLGREAPGFDPLTAHADLKAKVDGGDMDRAQAMEMARLRQHEQLQREQLQTRDDQHRHEQEVQYATTQVASLGSTLRAADPDFERKFSFLMPAVRLIEQRLPPSQWAQEIQRAYAALPPMPAAAPAPAAALRNPTRPNSAPALNAKPKTAEEAFEMGVATARAAGQ